MMKRLILATALGVALSGAALAQDKPAAAPKAPAAEAAAPKAPAAAPKAPAAEAPAPKAPAAEAPAPKAPAAEAPAPKAPAAAEPQAATDPAADACLQKAFELAQSAEQKKLTEQDLDTLEQMLGKMESHCDANESAEADKIGAEIKAMLDKK